MVKTDKTKSISYIIFSGDCNIADAEESMSMIKDVFSGAKGIFIDIEADAEFDTVFFQIYLSLRNMQGMHVKFENKSEQVKMLERVYGIKYPTGGDI